MESELKASEDVKLANAKSKRDLAAAAKRMANLEESHAKVVATLKDQIASLEAANKSAVTSAGSNASAEIATLKAQLASARQSEASIRDKEAALQTEVAQLGVKAESALADLQREHDRAEKGNKTCRTPSRRKKRI